MRRSIFWGALAILFLDQATKMYIRTLGKETIKIIPGAFHITPVTNYGIGFGLLQGLVPFVIAATIFIIMGLCYYLRNMPETPLVTLSFALLLGGSVGNLIDRSVFGYVIDFLDFHIWPVFNIADSAVTVGGALLLFWLYREEHV